MTLHLIKIRFLVVDCLQHWSISIFFNLCMALYWKSICRKIIVTYAYDTSTSDGTIISSSYTTDYDEDEVINKSDDDTVTVDFVWNIGPVQILFPVGFGLKIIDFICNWCIATPTITRSREEQWEYENLSLVQSDSNNKMDVDIGSSPALLVAGTKIEGDNYFDHGDDDDNSTQEVV